MPSVATFARPLQSITISRHFSFSISGRDTRVILGARRGKKLAQLSPQVLTPEDGMHDREKLVLLVEDNEDNRIVYSTILRHFGYAVSEAINGEDGVSMARTTMPDLILMDISIPLLDGWEATRILKDDPHTQHIPIVALTANAFAADRQRATEAGCAGYLSKPCEPSAVVAEVSRLIGPS